MGRACTPGGFKLARQMAGPPKVKAPPLVSGSPILADALEHWDWADWVPLGYRLVAKARQSFATTWQAAFDHAYRSSSQTRGLLLSAVKAGAFDRLIASGELVVPTP